MTLYRGRSRIELDIEKNRNEGNWRKVSDLVYQLNVKNINNDNLAAFLKNECALEQYLEDNAPNEKNIPKALNNLLDVKYSLINLINSISVKNNQQDIAFESELLLAKLYYACGQEQEVLNIYKNLDLVHMWNPSNASIRNIGLVAELYAMNAFCLERKPPSYLSRSIHDTDTFTNTQDIFLESSNSDHSISHQLTLERQCRQSWRTQIVSDLKCSLLYGYSYLQKKFEKVNSSAGAVTLTAPIDDVSTSVSTVPPYDLDSRNGSSSIRDRRKKKLTGGGGENKALKHDKISFKGGIKKAKRIVEKKRTIEMEKDKIQSGENVELSTLSAPHRDTLSKIKLNTDKDIRSSDSGIHRISTNLSPLCPSVSPPYNADSDEANDSDGNNTYPSPPSGYVLEKAFLKLPIIFLKSGQILKAIIVYRYQLSLVETKYTQSIRQVLCRQLIEVMMKGVCHSTYVPIHLSDRTLENELTNDKSDIFNRLSVNRNSSIKDTSSKQTPADALSRAFHLLTLTPTSSSSMSSLTPLTPGSLNLTLNPKSHFNSFPSLFSPSFLFDELLLLALICRALANSAAILSLAPEHEEARVVSADDVARVNDALSLTIGFGAGPEPSCSIGFGVRSLANIRRYKLLAITLERSVKFNPDKFHTWYQFALSLYTSAFSNSTCSLDNNHNFPLSFSATFSHQNGNEHRGGDMYKTLRALEECHRMRPNNITVLLFLSRVCLEGLSDIDRGIEFALKAVDLCQQYHQQQHTHQPFNNRNSDFCEGGSNSLSSARTYNALGLGYFYKSKMADIAYSHPQRIRYLQLALENFKKALNIDPQNLDFAFNLALQHAILRQLPQATKLAELCLVTELNHFQACHLLILLKTAPSFPRSTLAPRFLKQKNNNSAGYETNPLLDDLRRGQDEKHNLKQALELVDSLIQQCPKNFNLYFTKAEIEGKHFGYETALMTYRAMLNIWKEMRDRYIERESEYYNLVKKWEQRSKVDVYEKETNASLYGGGTLSFSKPMDLAATSEMISLTNTQQSNDSFRSHHMSNFQAIQFHVWLKIAQLYMDQQLLEDAYMAIKEAEEISRTSHHILDMWGKFYMCLDDAQTAKEYFESSLSINPNFVDALQDLSLAYFYLQNFEMAETKIREALKIEPTSHKSWYYLGHIYHMNENKISVKDLASDYYFTALDLHSSSPVRTYDILRPIF
ncbi:unnamed protein product [Gordionus sp. m RMFG-2023]|uniref:tetratricopeptide repeat protein 7B-like n=1 Tax=Gordionus sp. m RMFG-2023 TaxID=3053472 RepID=UPI0030DE2B93